MALHIRDEETDRLVRALAVHKGVALTEAVKLAVRNELEREGAMPSLWEQLQPLLESIAARGSTGIEADKAFYDSLYDE